MSPEALAWTMSFVAVITMTVATLGHLAYMYGYDTSRLFPFYHFAQGVLWALLGVLLVTL